MTSFHIQGVGIGNKVLRRDGGAEVSHIVIPDENLREVGEALIDLADAKDALTEFFAEGGKPMAELHSAEEPQ